MRCVYCHPHCRKLGSAFLILLMSLASVCGAQFFELTVELEAQDWNFAFVTDERQDDAALSAQNSQDSLLFRKPLVARCVISSNNWLISGEFLRNGYTARWFTGTNVVEESLIHTEIPAKDIERASRALRMTVRAPKAGDRHASTRDLQDDNPGRPVRVRDEMLFPERVLWLAYCSGPAMRREGRRIYPPSDLWKEFVAAPEGFRDSVTCFPDELGLPRHVELFTPKDRLIFQYQVHHATNFMGSTIPLEFYGVQYKPALTNQWCVQLTFKGRVTAISTGAPPERPLIPATATK